MLGRHPYLGAAFEFIERQPGTAPFLGRLHNFTFGAFPSLGLTGAAITGIKYGVRRLVNGLARDLFREDCAGYYRNLLTYAVPELETLEGEFEWLSRFGSEALRPEELIDDLDPDLLALLHRELPAQNPHQKSAGEIRPQRGRVKPRPPRKGAKAQTRRRPGAE